MTTLYKLTNKNHQTYGGCQWGDGVEHTASGEGDLCGPGWLHAYTHPLLAVLLNPVHANYATLVLWEADGDVGKTDHGLKVGCTRLKTMRVIPLPAITTEQRVRFAIMCAKRVYTCIEWNEWADAWLSGKDRSADAAYAAERAVYAERAAYAAANAAAGAAERAAYAAANAAAGAAEAADIDLIAIAEEACR